MAPDTIALAPLRTKHLPRFRRASPQERPAFRLTDRDREALKTIYENRWITAEMLQDLLSPVTLTPRQQEALGKLIQAKKARASGPETAERRQGTKREIRRRLQMLYHNGYVQRHKVSDGEAIAYALGNLGAEELVLHYGIDSKEIEWTTKNRESGERYIRHALMVTRFRHALALALRNFPEASVEQWIPSGAFTAKVRYQDTVRTREGSRTQEVDGVVKPDGLFVVEVGEKRIHYFLECDRSTMSNARYLAKLKSYFAFWATYVKDGTKPSGITQMRVLSVTISEARKDNLRETAQHVSPEAKNLFWFICEKAYRGKPQEILKDTWQTLEDKTLRRL
jgi:Replication-relaxation